MRVSSPGRTVRVADGEPGDELQVDFGRMGLLADNGRRRVVWALILTACYSRHTFVWLTFRQTTEEVIAGCEAAWAFFGGVFAVVGGGGEELPAGGTCINCHAIQGTDAKGRSAPDLTHFASRTTFAGAMFETNEENLANWLRDPPAMKPGSFMPDYGLSEEEITQLVAYLMSLE